MSFFHGIAFLSLYVDDKQSNKYLKKIQGFSKVEGFQELELMRTLISTSKGKLRIRKKVAKS